MRSPFELKMTFLGLVAIVAPMVRVIEKYVFADWQFLIFLLILVGIDTALGLVHAFNKSQLDSNGFGQVIKKLTIYFILLILSHVLVHFTVDGHENVLFSWFNTAVYSSLMTREAISIVTNLGKLYPGLVPPFIVKRLKDFDENGTERQ